ncbi:MAG: putative quinol monooxygenase [Myxococcota bacterium]
MIAVTAELKAKDGRQEDLEAQLGRLAEQVRDGEPGCRLYVFARSKHDPQLYVTLERYDDEEALAAHSHADHYTAALRGMMDCLEAPPRVALFEEV